MKKDAPMVDSCVCVGRGSGGEVNWEENKDERGLLGINGSLVCMR